ncbi:uncharacterized protein LOC143208328 isoform X2 [Lasioglossum baleicum]|uniref:uncharacterized protein LOC143208328 isoform X2 n=1 Tax=Lasioglossum baleicum TaxID=434251 RepID=UPI003FCC56A8
MSPMLATGSLTRWWGEFLSQYKGCPNGAEITSWESYVTLRTGTGNLLLDRRTCSMASYKVCFTLATILVSANAAFNPTLFDSFPIRDHSWISDDHLDSASSEHSSSYSPFSSLKKRQSDYESSYERPKGWFSPSFKKEPREDKSYKKIISPVYTIREKDSSLYKDIVFKSGVPYCQESKTKRANRDKNAKDSLVCYKCRNPKNGSTYEQCSYVSQPLSETSNIEKVLEAPSGFRFRRSNSEESLSDFKRSPRERYSGPSDRYRFDEKIFSDSTQDVPEEYKMKDEECEKVVKDTMVCMVCRDKKSNGKYEQCSYVSQPKEKKYAYSKSAAYKNPENKDDDDDDKKPVSETLSEKEDKEKLSEEASESNCKKVEKGSKTCTICKDPKTGSNSEKCSYAYQPDDKVYKYSRSKSFGNKETPSDSPSSTQVPVYKGSYSKKPEEYKDYSSEYSSPEKFYQKSGSSYFSDREEPSARYRKSEDVESYLSDYEKSKSESERIAKSIEPSNCKEVEKDSMTCTMCKDPKTGAVSEQCSYKYKPNEKKFVYSKSKSFGSPTKEEDKSSDKSTEQTEKSESREPYFDRSYGFGPEKAAYSDDDNSKKGYREFQSGSESKPEVKEQPSSKSPEESRFYDAFEKKAEISKFLQDFQKEDRSNCKKLMRDKMTCYQCVDEKGFRQEECAFATTEDSNPDKSEKTESKEDAEPSKKVPRSYIIDKRIDDAPLDSHAAATEDHARVDVPGEQKTEDETKGVDAYAYVAETRPVYDRVLGFTLPAYMLESSEYEQEFDKSYGAGGN